MNTINRCAYLDREHRFEIRHEAIPEPKQDEALVKIKVNGICGSDIHFFTEGQLGNFAVTVPYIPGHEAAGEIVSIGSEVKNLTVGDRVIIEPGIPCGRCALCLSGKYNLCPSVVFLSAPPTNGTFCDYICVCADFLHLMPDQLSFEDGALAEPAAVAVHAVNQAIRSGGIEGRSAIILGAGPIGLMTLQAYKAMGGGEVTCVDISALRLEKAQQLGADTIVNTTTDTLEDNCVEVVFETAGSPQATAQIFNLARPGGIVIQVGWPVGNLVTMNIANFIEKELTYKSVNRYANVFPAAIRYLTDRRIKAEQMISRRFALDDVAEAFCFAHDHSAEVVKIVVVNES